MSNGQVRVICTGIALVVLAGMFPAWIQTYDDGAVRVDQAIGYAPIFSPPAPAEIDYGVRLDIPRLLLTWCIIGAATFGIWWWVGRRKPLTVEQRWPWKRVARWLYGWYYWSWFTVIVSIVSLPRAWTSLSQASYDLPQRAQLWMLFEVVARLIVLVLYLFATVNFVRQPAYAVRYFHAAYMGMVGLGVLGLLTVMAIFPEDMWPIFFAQHTARVILGLFFLWVIRPLRSARFHQLYRMLDDFHDFGVPAAFVAPATGTPPANQPHTVQLDKPRKRINPVRLLRAITTGQVVMPANVQALRSDGNH